MTKPQPSSPARNVYAADCPTRHVLDQLANKWTVLILGILHEGPQRHGAMLRAAQGVSPRVLTRTLRDLERDGLVERRLLSASPPAVEYSLSALGHELEEIVAPLRDWAERRVDDIHAARGHFDAHVPGQDRTPWQRPKPLPW